MWCWLCGETYPCGVKSGWAQWSLVTQFQFHLHAIIDTNYYYYHHPCYYNFIIIVIFTFFNKTNKMYIRLCNGMDFMKNKWIKLVLLDNAGTYGLTTCTQTLTISVFLRYGGIFIASFLRTKPFNLYKTIINKDGKWIKQFIQCACSSLRWPLYLLFFRFIPLLVLFFVFALNSFKSVCVTWDI